ncbi:DUF4352 domain-containing protein [Isoptericola croceus]|uniref:DUF4352 domain-containing protein n=1 Tax=Isoptericola croceus TaxID=3031406 RepID=UPI0023F918B8|nr:DUF4352 domain-containing protein [Isoptericola croceus]
MSTQHPDPSQQQPSSFAPPPAASAPAGAPPSSAGQPIDAVPQMPYGAPPPSSAATGQPPQGWAPHPPAPEKRKNWFARHKVLTGLGALVGVAIVGAALGGGDEEPVVPDGGAQVVEDAPAAASTDEGGADAEAAEPAEEPVESELPGLGDAVRDGKFEFTVTELEDGVEQIGNDFLNETAQGQYVLVHVTVENIGDEAQYFDGSSQKLVDTEGRTHSADSSAAIYLDDSNSFLNEINPGNTVDGVVVFDLPKKATPATLELHDSMFSGGVEVSVE